MRAILAFLVVLVSVSLAMAQAVEGQLGGSPGAPGEPLAVIDGPHEETAPLGPDDDLDEPVQERLIPPVVLMKDARLSQEQKKRLATEAFGYMAKINLLRGELENLEMEKMVIQNLDELNPAKVKDAYGKIAGIEADIYLARREYIKTVNSILTADQLKQLVSSPRMFRQRRHGEGRFER